MKKWSTSRIRCHSLSVALLSSLLTVGCANMNGAISSKSRVSDVNSLAISQSLSGDERFSSPWPPVDWWQRYGDTQLSALVAEALVGTPSLRIAEARVRQASSLAGLAEAASVPQVSANLRDTRQRYSENSTIPKPLAGTWKTFNEATLNLGYELDFWGKNKASIDAALDRVRASEVDARASQLLLAAGVVQAYLRLAQAYDQLELAQSVLKQQEALLKFTQQRFEMGIDSQVELKQAESVIPAGQQVVAFWQETIELTSNQLAALIAKGPDRGRSIARPRLSLPQAMGVPSVLPAELIGRRPDVVAQRWRVEAGSREVDSAKAQFYPNVSLLAFVGFQSLGLSHFFDAGSRVAGVGPAISLPIFDGGRLRSNLGNRHSEYDIAVEQYNQTLLDALHDVVGLITSIKWVEEQQRQQNSAVRTAESAYEMAVQRFEAGIGSYLQVLSAELQVNGQKKLFIDLKWRLFQLDANLARALGGAVLES